MVGGRTTTRHKADNTFKFNTFTEQLSKINVSIWSDFRGDLGRGTLDKDTENSPPYFLKCVEKWSDQDLSGDFTELVSKIGCQIQNLAQIIHDARRLIDTIYDHITVEKKQCLPATLELATALSTDLLTEFKSDRYRLMERIIEVVTTLKDAVTVEHGFKTLAYLLKHGQKEVMADFNKYFLLIKPLIQSSSIHLQVVACQTYSRITGQLWKRSTTAKFVPRIIAMMFEHGLKGHEMALLISTLIRGPGGKLTVDGSSFFRDTLLMCFEEYKNSELWKAMTLSLLTTLFDDYRDNEHGCSKQLAMEVVELTQSEKVTKSPARQFYFLLLSKVLDGVFKMEGSEEARWSQVDRILKHMEPLLHDLDHFTSTTHEEISTTLVSLMEICSADLNTSAFSNLLETMTKFLKARNVDVPLKRKILDKLAMNPNALREVIVTCGKEFPSALTPLVLISDRTIGMRKLPHQPIGKKPNYLQGGICTAVDTIKSSARPLSTTLVLPDEFVNKAFGFGDEWSGLPSDEFPDFDESIRNMLCMRDEDGFGKFIPYFFGTTPDFIPPYLDFDPYLQHLLVFADVLHNRYQHGLKSPIPPSIISVVNGLLALIGKSNSSHDHREVWILKTLDFLVGTLILCPPEFWQDPKDLTINFDEFDRILREYLHSGFVVIRATALSLQYHLSVLQKKEPWELVCQKCLEVELWNFEPCPLSEINKSMEDLVKIASRKDGAMNEFLMAFACGLLFSKYEPLRKQCKVLIQNCMDGNDPLCSIILEIIRSCHGLEKSPQFPEALKRINMNGGGAFEKYEATLCDIPSVGYLPSTGFSELNYDEYRILVWDILATSNLEQAGKTLKMQITRIGKELIMMHMRDSPFYGFQALEERKPPKFLPSVITCIGKCYHDVKSVLADKDSVLRQFLMSRDPTFRKAGIEASYAMEPNLLKYRDGINSALGPTTVTSLTDFGIDALKPIINARNERQLVMVALLPVIAQKFLDSLCSKRKAPSRNQRPILIGMMGFEVVEVKTFIELVIGTVEVEDLKKFDVKTLVSKLIIVDLMLKTWKHTFPDITLELLTLTVKIIQAVGGVNAFQGSEEKTEEKMETDEEEEEAGTDEEKMVTNEDGTNTQEERKTNGGSLPVISNREIFARAFTILHFVYENFPNVVTKSAISKSILETIVAPQIESLLTSSTGGVSTQLRFIALWGRIPRYRHLLVLKLPGSDLVPMTYLYQLLQTPSTSTQVKQFVVEIFVSLFVEPEPGDVEERGVEARRDELFQPSLSLETNILLAGRNILLYLNNYITYPLLLRRLDGDTKVLCSGLFQIFQRIISHSSPEEIGVAGKNLVTNFYLSNASYKFRARVDYLNMIREIIKKFPNDHTIIMHLSRTFRNKSNPEEEQALISLLDGYSDVECKDVLGALFARDPTDLTAPDYERRAIGWSKLREMFDIGKSTFDRTRFTLIGNALMGILKHDHHGMQGVQGALEIFERMKDVLVAKKPVQTDLEGFLNGVFLTPTLAQVIRNKPTPSQFENYLRLLRIFAKGTVGFHSILDGLNPLTATAEDGGLDVFLGLIDIQVNNRTKAMNRLLKLLRMQIAERADGPFKCFGENLLLGYLVPLATYFINSEKTDGKAQVVLDNLVDSSIQVYGAAAQLLTPKQYAKFLEEALADPPEDQGHLKRFKRKILAIVDGFSYMLVRPKTNEKELESEDEVVKQDLDELGLPSRGVVQVESNQIDEITNIFAPLLKRLTSQICNFSQKNQDGEFLGDEYNLMAESTLAVAKLLERFPPHLSYDVKDKLVPEICACLKSKEHRKRLVARNTLKLLMSVRTNFISFGRVLSYLRANLKVGYQKHVLTHAVYTILSSCEQRFRETPSEVSTRALIPLCQEEFFGVMEEEKRVAEIREKTYEARFPNAKNILTFYGKISQSPEDVCEMILAGLGQLRVKRSDKKHVETWLDAIETGINQNEKIDVVEVLRILKTKMEEYKAESKALVDTEVAVAQKPKVKSSALDIKPLPSKTVKDTFTSEIDLLLLFQYKVIFNVFRNGTHQSHFLREYYISVVESLKHQSNPIMLMSHRIITLFVAFDRERTATPASLLPGGDGFRGFWESLIVNVVNYCDRSPSEETVNVIFSSVTTFLSANGDLKLKRQDLDVLLSTLHRFLTNGFCVSSGTKLLNHIIELKLEVGYIEEIMDEVLKMMTRSTTPHVVEACRKVTLNYIMVYGASRWGGMDKFLSQIWANGTKAERSHETMNILTLVCTIIQSVPPSAYPQFFNKVPTLALSEAFSESTEVHGACFKILEEFLNLPNGIGVALPLARSLITKEPQRYQAVALKFLYRLFNKITRSPAPDRDYIKQFTNFFLELLKNGDGFLKGMKAAYQFSFELTQDYVKDGIWNRENMRKWKLKKLIRFIGTEGLNHISEFIKRNALDLISVLIYESENSFILQSDGTRTPIGALPFLKDETDILALLDSHFDILSHSASIDMKKRAGGNLDFFLQWICYNPNALEPKHGKEFPTHVIDKIKRLINEEVTQHPENYLGREIGYALLTTFVYLTDVTVTESCYVGKNYEKRRTPLAQEFLTETFLGNARKIIHLGIRDVTDGNVKDELKRNVESLLALLRTRIGSEGYEKMESEVRDLLHVRRRQNKAKKAEAAVNFPGKTRKRKSGGKSGDGGGQSSKRAMQEA